MQRDMVWHELYERMRNGECPICELIHDRTEKSMEGFLYESVNDLSLRGKIYRSGGFCNYHAYMLMDMGAPLAHALIYSDLLGGAIRNLQTPLSKKQAGIFQAHPDCPFCLQAAESEAIYIRAFADSMSDDEFRKRYIESGMLCLAHLDLIKTDKNRRNAEIITAVTLVKYGELISQLSEIKRKNDHRFTGETWTEQEKTAWKRAVCVIDSHRGIRK